MKQRCYENTYRISNNLPPSNSSFLSNWKEKLKNFKKRKELSKNPFPSFLPSFQQSSNKSPPHKTKTDRNPPVLKERDNKKKKEKKKLVGNNYAIGSKYYNRWNNRITLNKLAFNRLFSPDPLEFVRGSAALPSHTWNLRGWHTLSGGVPCSRCVFTFKSRKLCQGSAACINKSASRCARYVSLSLGW